MSIEVNMKTGNKAALARVLEKIAAFIEVSSNASVTISLKLTFDTDPAKEGE